MIWIWLFSHAHDRFLECFQYGKSINITARGEDEMSLYLFGVEFIYGKAKKLYLRGEIIMSATEVQQGDPLRQILLAPMTHLIHKIKDNYMLLFTLGILAIKLW